MIESVKNVLIGSELLHIKLDKTQDQVDCNHSEALHVHTIDHDWI